MQRWLDLNGLIREMTGMLGRLIGEHIDVSLVLSTHRHDAGSGVTETLLLVEDEEGVRQFSKRTLDDAGYHVLESANGDDAEQLFIEHSDSIDLLVTDVVMPGCGGPELLGRLRIRTPDLKVLYMSGYTDQSAVTQSGIEKGHPFVQKPFRAAELLRHVREALDQ